MVDEGLRESGPARTSAPSLPESEDWLRSQPTDPFSGWRGLPRRLKRVLGRCRALLRLSESMADLSVSLPERVARLGARLDALDQLGAELRGELAGICRQMAEHQAAVNAELGRLQAQIGPDAFGGLQRELSAQLAFSLHDIVQQVIANTARVLSEASSAAPTGPLAAIEGQVQRLANEQFEAKNTLIHRLEKLNTVASEARNAAIHANTNLETRLNTIEHTRVGSLYEQMHDLTAALLRVRAKIEAPGYACAQLTLDGYKPVPSDLLDASLRRARDEFPRVYPLWEDRLEEMRKACLETKIGNVAHPGDAGSETFCSFVEIHARGRALDVGCGVFGRPYYLASYPAALLSGLDPLTPIEPPDFEFTRGIQEYLPWPDGAFSTVISATSLDHCLSLDRSLAEIHRVLRPDGQFLLWIGSVPGASQYEPDAADFTPVDRFHLFHFDAAWFEPMLDRWFDVVERIRLRGREFDHLMYCLRLRAARPAQQPADRAS